MGGAFFLEASGGGLTLGGVVSLRFLSVGGILSTTVFVSVGGAFCVSVGGAFGSMGGVSEGTSSTVEGVATSLDEASAGLGMLLFLVGGVGACSSDIST